MYKKWELMRRRCNNPNDISYPRYGGRGIKVCKRWDKFENFREDMGPPFVLGMTLERIDSSDWYTPNNCKWVPLEEQSKNRRGVKLIEYGGRRMTIPDWEKALGMKKKTLYNRIRVLKWSIADAIEIPIL